MTYKKYLVVASKKDKAGINITTILSQFRKNPVLSSISKDTPSFDFYLLEDEVIYNESLDMEKINKYDFIIFASKHQSEKQVKSLSVHAPGNWRQADYGGEPNTISKSSALFQKQLFANLNKQMKDSSLTDYEVTLECTHHGPTIDKPCVFIEIGSSETEWNDRRAAFVIAKTISETIENFKENPYHEIAFAIGGPHYCPNFNKIQAKSNLAISHIIPEYSLPLTEEMLKQVLEKTEEDIDFALLDWKGLGNSESRQQVLNLLDKLYIRYEKTSKINKITDYKN